jgi:hypothetical protein
MSAFPTPPLPGSKESVRTNDTKIMVQMNTSMTNKFFDKSKYNELVIGSPFDSGDKKQVLKKINQGSGLGTGRISIDNSLNNEKEPSMI